MAPPEGVPFAACPTPPWECLAARDAAIGRIRGGHEIQFRTHPNYASSRFAGRKSACPHAAGPESRLDPTERALHLLRHQVEPDPDVMVDIITEIGKDCRNADAVICTNDSGAIIRWKPRPRTASRPSGRSNGASHRAAAPGPTQIADLSSLLQAGLPRRPQAVVEFLEQAARDCKVLL